MNFLIPKDRKVEPQDIVLLLGEFFYISILCILSINVYCELFPFFPCHMVSNCWRKTRKQICMKPTLFDLPKLFFFLKMVSLCSLTLNSNPTGLYSQVLALHMCSPHSTFRALTYTVSSLHRLPSGQKQMCLHLTCQSFATFSLLFFPSIPIPVFSDTADKNRLDFFGRGLWEVKFRVFYMLRKGSTTDLYPQPRSYF